MDWAEASLRDLTTLVQEVLRTNVNMAARLKNLERMHPALAIPSTCASQDDNAIREAGKSRSVSRLTYNRFAFEQELEMSTVYKKAALYQKSVSRSSNSSNGPSCLSGLSLCDVTNASSIALPISAKELWNHHRYSHTVTGLEKITSLEAWYYPPAKVSLDWKMVTL